MTSSYEHHVAVCSDLTIQCIDSMGRTHGLDTIFSYNESDPYAVTITFLTHEGDLPWTFSRDLLVRGLTTPVGDGDVHVCPSVNDRGQAIVIIELSSPDGHLVTEAHADQVQAFIESSLEVVPQGEESHHLHMDQMIAQLLED